MRSKVIVILACVALIVVGVGAAALAEGQPLPHRYLQHEEAQQFDDLSEADRVAASSTSTYPETFASHLPVISIDTHGQEIPGEPMLDEDGSRLADEDGKMIPTLAEDGLEYITADIAVYDEQNGVNTLDDTASLESKCQFRIRGNSSRVYDKKNYRVVLVNEDGTDNDQKLLGMESCETWVLHGPAIDKSLLRNYLTYNTAGQFMGSFVPEARYFELFINGQYQGLYLAVESVKIENGRLELTPSDPDYDETSYIVAIDEAGITSTTVSNFLRYTLRLSKYIDIVYPSEENLTQEQRDYIEADLSAFEKALFSYDYDTASYGYWRYIDVDSFVDMFILNEFVINDDFGAYSTYLYKDVRGKITMGPPWDYDNTYDCYANETAVDKFYTVERAWYFMLFKDEDFCEKVINRYRELREGVLSEENLFRMIDETIEYLGPAIERNWEVWDYTFEEDDYLTPESRKPLSFEEAVDDLKSFIHERGEWLDTYIENLRQYSHESAVKKFNH